MSDTVATGMRHDVASATDVLRAMLDERGVEWEEVETCGQVGLTRFNVNGVWMRYVEYSDYSWIDYNEDEPLTPERAIAATLDRGECHDKNGFDADYGFECVECGTIVDSYMSSTHPGIPEQFRYCPGCGRKVAQ